MWRWLSLWFLSPIFLKSACSCRDFLDIKRYNLNSSCIFNLDNSFLATAPFLAAVSLVLYALKWEKSRKSKYPRGGSLTARRLGTHGWGLSGWNRFWSENRKGFPVFYTPGLSFSPRWMSEHLLFSIFPSSINWKRDNRLKIQ